LTHGKYRLVFTPVAPRFASPHLTPTPSRTHERT